MYNMQRCIKRVTKLRVLSGPQGYPLGIQKSLKAEAAGEKTPGGLELHGECVESSNILLQNWQFFKKFIIFRTFAM